MIFIEYPKCTTCKKAKKWLDDRVVEDNPTFDELKTWYKKSGLPLKRFFNTSGLLYKSMELKDRLATMSEDEQLTLLASNGMLVKRPLLITDNAVIPGFREKEWENAINEE